MRFQMLRLPPLTSQAARLCELRGRLFSVQCEPFELSGRLLAMQPDLLALPGRSTNCLMLPLESQHSTCSHSRTTCCVQKCHMFQPPDVNVSCLSHPGPSACPTLPGDSLDDSPHRDPDVRPEVEAEWLQQAAAASGTSGTSASTPTNAMHQPLPPQEQVDSEAHAGNQPRAGPDSSGLPPKPRRGPPLPPKPLTAPAGPATAGTHGETSRHRPEHGRSGREANGCRLASRAPPPGQFCPLVSKPALSVWLCLSPGRG